ncbi:MAG: efflux RND transporter periplasmic adaptor subunit [Candidatus Rokubacteria bacterium]|nr:efflux RND transporter periplasmic adaptor subunit [Candidatus Rokubacteria bacterium]
MKRIVSPALAVLLALALVPAPAFVPPAEAANESFDCLMEPHVVVSVGAAVEGLLEAVNVDRGDLVAKGEVIATLESSAERAAVALAAARAQIESATKSSQARFDFGVRRWVRTDELFKQNLIPLRELDEAETQKVLAEIGVLEAKENRTLAHLELERAKAALALKTIRSPFDGVVVERLLSPGELVEQAPILKIAQIDPLRVEVILPVSMLGKVTLGTQAQVMPDAPVTKEPLAARVKIVDRVADAASGTFGVRLEVPNPSYRLPAGLRCTVRFLD